MVRIIFGCLFLFWFLTSTVHFVWLISDLPTETHQEEQFYRSPQGYLHKDQVNVSNYEPKAVTYATIIGVLTVAYAVIGIVLIKSGTKYRSWRNKVLNVAFQHLRENGKIKLLELGKIIPARDELSIRKVLAWGQRKGLLAANAEIV